MEVEVRKSVIEAFARGFVKNIHNTDAMKETAAKIVESTKEAVEKQARDILAEQGVTTERIRWNTYKTTLGDDITKQITREVGGLVYDQIHDAVGNINIDSVVAKQVERKVEVAVNREVNKVVGDKVMEAVAQVLS
jgi:hypothetical protein